MSQVRAAALTNYERVARFVGLDPSAMLRALGLNPSLLADPEQPLPVTIVSNLLEESARRSGCEHFGLLMAESRSLGSIGPAALMLKHQPTAGDVIHAIVRHQRRFGLALQLEVETFGGLLRVHAELDGVAAARQGVELLLAYCCRCIAAIVGCHWTPESVHFTHSAPADLSVHARLFACPVEFGSDVNAFVCTPELVLAENPSADAELAQHAERFLGMLVPPGGAPTAKEQARRSLRLLLPAGRGSLDQVAINLCTSPRSLQRQLEREGCTFGDLLNEVRRELAQRYLAVPAHQIVAVAEMTGYRTASSFSRWFSAEFGMPPAAWRVVNRQG